MDNSKLAFTNALSFYLLAFKCEYITMCFTLTKCWNLLQAILARDSVICTSLFHFCYSVIETGKYKSLPCLQSHNFERSFVIWLVSVFISLSLDVCSKPSLTFEPVDSGNVTSLSAGNFRLDCKESVFCIRNESSSMR